MDNNELNNKAEQLRMQGDILHTVEEWWSVEISLKISEHNYLKQKLANTWNEQDFNRMSQLERDIEHLQKKSTWELKEVSKYETKCADFEKIQSKAKLIKFTKNLKKINKHFDK